jgi:hypothetical protein
VIYLTQRRARQASRLCTKRAIGLLIHAPENKTPPDFHPAAFFGNNILLRKKEEIKLFGIPMLR